MDASAQEGVPGWLEQRQSSLGGRAPGGARASHPQARTSGAEVGRALLNPRGRQAGRAWFCQHWFGFCSQISLIRSHRGVQPTYLDRVSHLALPFLGSTSVLTLLPASCTFSPRPCPPESRQTSPPGQSLPTQDPQSLAHLSPWTQGLGLSRRMAWLKSGPLDLDHPFLDLSPVLCDQSHHECGRKREAGMLNVREGGLLQARAPQCHGRKNPHTRKK